MSVRRESVRLISSGKKDNNFIRSLSTKGPVDRDPLVFILLNIFFQEEKNSSLIKYIINPYFFKLTARCLG